jgi:hypothetical protein
MHDSLKGDLSRVREREVARVAAQRGYLASLDLPRNRRPMLRWLRRR